MSVNIIGERVSLDGDGTPGTGVVNLRDTYIPKDMTDEKDIDLLKKTLKILFKKSNPLKPCNARQYKVVSKSLIYRYKMLRAELQKKMTETPDSVEIRALAGRTKQFYAFLQNFEKSNCQSVDLDKTQGLGDLTDDELKALLRQFLFLVIQGYNPIEGEDSEKPRAFIKSLEGAIEQPKFEEFVRTQGAFISPLLLDIINILKLDPSVTQTLIDDLVNKKFAEIIGLIETALPADHPFFTGITESQRKDAKFMVDRLLTFIKELQAELEKKGGSTETLNAELGAAKLDAENKQKEIDKLKAELKETQDTLNQTLEDDKTGEKNKEIEEWQRIIAKLNGRIKELSEAKATFENAIARLEQKIDEQTAEIARLRALIETLQKPAETASDIKNERDSLKTKIEQMGPIILKSQEEIGILERKLVLVNGIIQQLREVEQELRGLPGSGTESKTESGTESGTESKTDSDVGTNTSDIEGIIQKLRSTAEEVIQAHTTDLTEQREVISGPIKAKVIEMRKEIERLTALYSKKEADKKKMVEDIEGLIVKIREELDILESERPAGKDASLGTEENKESLKAEFATLLQELDEANAEYERCKQEQATLLDAANQELETMKGKLDLLQASYDEKVRTIEGLEGELQTLRENPQGALQQTLGATNQLKTGHEEELATLKRESEAQIADLQAKIQSLQSGQDTKDLGRTGLRIGVLTSEIKDLKSQLEKKEGETERRVNGEYVQEINKLATWLQNPSSPDPQLDKLKSLLEPFKQAFKSKPLDLTYCSLVFFASHTMSIHFPKTDNISSGFDTLIQILTRDDPKQLVELIKQLIPILDQMEQIYQSKNYGTYDLLLEKTLLNADNIRGNIRGTDITRAKIDRLMELKTSHYFGNLVVQEGSDEIVFKKDINISNDILSYPMLFYIYLFAVKKYLVNNDAKDDKCPLPPILKGEKTAIQGIPFPEKPYLDKAYTSEELAQQEPEMRKEIEGHRPPLRRNFEEEAEEQYLMEILQSGKSQPNINEDLNRYFTVLENKEPLSELGVALKKAYDQRQEEKGQRNAEVRRRREEVEAEKKREAERKRWEQEADAEIARREKERIDAERSEKEKAEGKRLAAEAEAAKAAEAARAAEAAKEIADKKVRELEERLAEERRQQAATLAERKAQLEREAAAAKVAREAAAAEADRRLEESRNVIFRAAEQDWNLHVSKINKQRVAEGVKEGYIPAPGTKSLHIKNYLLRHGINKNAIDAYLRKSGQGIGVRNSRTGKLAVVPRVGGRTRKNRK